MFESKGLDWIGAEGNADGAEGNDEEDDGPGAIGTPEDINEDEDG